MRYPAVFRRRKHTETDGAPAVRLSHVWPLERRLYFAGKPSPQMAARISRPISRQPTGVQPACMMSPQR